MNELDLAGAREAVRSIVEEVAFKVAALPLRVRDLFLQRARKDFEVCFQMRGVDPSLDAGAGRAIDLVVDSILALLKDIDESSDRMAS
jgi:hypothetical protein